MVFRFRRPRKRTRLVAGAEFGRPAKDNRPGPPQGYTPEPRRIEVRASDGYPHGWELPAFSPPQFLVPSRDEFKSEPQELPGRYPGLTSFQDMRAALGQGEPEAAEARPSDEAIREIERAMTL